ncbi:complement factor H-related protein 5 isoform X2 [Echinops telfairi]|uniref:Complement factor H-related protein 5 isoform X2 n=1 Tax=Echinops telfairi TaxID=9371 RepID=A0ABM0IGY4_ECHTE|nr:complement factor H-related protein 5 isoform X2 [Echinops telfairi]
MLLLIHVMLILWVATVEGQVEFCDFPNIKHGILHDENRHIPGFPGVPVGNVFYYSCEHGFASPSKSFWSPTTCTANGWLPMPKCLRLCFFPSVKNGHSASSGQTHMEGDTVKIDCDAGYNLPNNGGTISCTEDGWSSPPQCSPNKIECSVPLFNENINVSPKKERYKAGDVLKFTCRRGFTRVGPDSIQCYQFGWSPSIPTCKEQVKPCGPTPHLLNGKIKDIWKEEYQHSEVVEYDCDPNFQMKGPKKIQCMDGEWTTLPICVENLKTCGYLPTLEHGYVQTTSHVYHHGHSVETECQSSYTMIGNNIITCINGIWTQLPTCIETNKLKKCKIPRVHFSVPSRFLFRDEYNHNTTITYRCLHSRQYQQTTCIHGKWDPDPACTRNVKSCPPPPQIPNAQNMTTTVNYQDGEEVSVLCKENYLLQESKELVCKHGQWQSLPQCVEFTGQCGPPPTVANGDLTSFPLTVYPPGSRVRYLCQSFYKLRGSQDITCRNGQWSESPRCLDPCVISEESMKKNNIQLRWSENKKLYSKTGDVVEFKCMETYQMKTPERSFRTTCQEGKIEYPSCA